MTDHHDDDAWPLHLLLAGDVHDAPRLLELVDLLPVYAHGQMFVEVGTTGGQLDVDPAQWVLPPGVGLHVLRRAPGAPRPRRGQLVAAAVSAWAAEWLPDDVCGCAGPFALWVGCAASPDVENLCRDLVRRLDMAPVHLHRPDL